MQRAFFVWLWQQPELERVADRAAVQQQIKEHHARLIAVAPKPLGSVDARHHQAACLVLAAFRELNAAGVARGVAISAITEAICRPGQRFISMTTKLMLAMSRDPMSTLVNYSNNRIPPAYGDGFSFNSEGDAQQQFIMRVTKCFYYDFFQRHGCAELTRVFCAWDRNWISAISESKHRVRFSRPGTIANGEGSCPFTFERLASKEAGAGD